MRENNEYINKFDACVKISLKHELLYRLKTIKNQIKHYINMSEMSDYICVKADGTLIQPDEASARFKSLIKRNKMPNIRLHDLRHSCAPMLIAR